MSSENAETPRLVSVINGGPHGAEAFGKDEKALGVFPDAISAATAVRKSGRSGRRAMRILGVDPGIRAGLAIVAVVNGAAPRLPEAHALLARRLDHGRAEAGLLALYGAQQ